MNPGATEKPSLARPLERESVLAMRAPAVERDNPLTRSPAGVIGLVFLALMLLACIGTLPWTLAHVGEGDATTPRYNAGVPREARLAPSWVPHSRRDVERQADTLTPDARAEVAADLAPTLGLTPAQVAALSPGDQHYDTYERALAARAEDFILGTDLLGRSLFVRVLTGGGISLTVGIAAALITVTIGTIYGALAGYFGGVLDAFLMRVVDVLYGLPYILLVVLLAVASNSVIDEYISRSKERAAWVSRVIEAEIIAGRVTTATELPPARPTRQEITEFRETHPERYEELLAEASAAIQPRQVSQGTRTFLQVATLLFAIAAVSWLTVARVVRGQVLSLKNQPFVEAARAMGAPTRRIFIRHLLPNLIGPIVVYATLAVPQAILQESFLSFLGIGIQPPLPSWGNLAAEGLGELNTYRSHWWLLFFPCLLLGLTLLALNYVGEGLREAFDPKRARK